VCCEDGEVRGYLPAEEELGGNLMDVRAEDQALRELNQLKQELMLQSQHYEKSINEYNPGDAIAADCIVPPDTQLNVEPQVTNEQFQLVLRTNNDAAIIKAVVVFGENVFEDSDSYVVHPKSPSETISVPLAPKKDVPTELLVKALVGSWGSTQFMLFEKACKVPKFAMYCVAQGRHLSTFERSVSKVSFIVQERAARVALWIRDAFNISVDAPSSHELDLNLVSLRDRRPLSIVCAAGAVDGMEVSFFTEDMELAGELVQDICGYLQKDELSSTADFATEMNKFQEILQKVEEYHAVRLRLTAEMADRSNTVKTLVIKAEDSRILGDMRNMKEHYSGLWNLNNELLGEYLKRHTNHTELVDCLKEVNQMIQKAARLRVGQAKVQVVSACRTAIKNNNIQSLFKIIKTGDAGPGAS